MFYLFTYIAYNSVTSKIGRTSFALALHSKLIRAKYTSKISKIIKNIEKYDDDRKVTSTPNRTLKLVYKPNIMPT